MSGCLFEILYFREHLHVESYSKLRHFGIFLHWNACNLETLSNFHWRLLYIWFIRWKWIQLTHLRALIRNSVLSQTRAAGRIVLGIGSGIGVDSNIGIGIGGRLDALGIDEGQSRSRIGEHGSHLSCRIAILGGKRQPTENGSEMDDMSLWALPRREKTTIFKDFYWHLPLVGEATSRGLGVGERGGGLRLRKYTKKGFAHGDGDVHDASH